MKTDPVDFLTYIGFALVGFLAKFLLERYSKHKDSVRLESWRLEVANLEEKLSQFYWPIHCRLERGAIAWDSENFRGEHATEEKAALEEAFDRDVIIRNHEETRDIIQKNFHHFGGDKELETALIRLLHHIDIYLSLRAAGSGKDPIWVGQPWPDEVNGLIERNLHRLQERYDSLVSRARSPY